MPDFRNPFTDTYRLVETQQVSGLKLLPQIIPPREGFALELYRNGVYQGSTRLGESLHARSGDVVYHVNLGSCSTLVEGVLTAGGKGERYQRNYKVYVELQVVDPSAFLLLYLQSHDPVSLVHMGIRSAIQEYGERNDYEDIHATGIQDKAKFALAGANNLRAGMRIIDAHQPYVATNPDYKRVIKESLVLNLHGQLKTLDRYRCDYKLTVELEVTDRAVYSQLEQQKAEPEKLAQVAIEGELEQFALQQRYADLTESQLRTVVERVFDTLPNRIAKCMKVVRTHSLSLDGSSSISSFWLSIKGQLPTRDRYIRPYEVSVEFQIINQLRYEQLKYEGADPQEMARKVIEGELQRYVSQQFYEDFTEAGLRSVVEHAFDNLSSRLVESIKIVYVPQFSLGEDSNYRPIPLHHLLTITGYLTTREEYVRPYKVTIDLQTTDPRRYWQLLYEKSDPLVHAQKSIHDALQSHTRQRFYENLTEDQLSEVAEGALGTFSSDVTSVIKMVRAFDFSLSAAPDYTARPDPLSVIGQVKTYDGRTRDYEIIVELGVANAPDFVKATRHGNDYRQRISKLISGAVQSIIEGKIHDDLSSEDLRQATLQAFDPAQNATIDGLKFVKVLLADLQIDPRIQEEKNIIHEAAIEGVRKANQARQAKVDMDDYYEARIRETKKEQELLSYQHILEETKNAFSLRKEQISKISEMSMNLNEVVIKEIGEVIAEKLQQGISILDVIQDVQALQLLSPPSPQTGQENRDNDEEANSRNQGVDSYIVSSDQGEFQVSQSGNFATSASRRKKKEIPELGVYLTECVLNDEQQDFIEVERAFQVIKTSYPQESNFRVADIFVQINGQNVYTLEALEDARSLLQPGKPVEVTVLRGNEHLELLTLNPLS